MEQLEIRAYERQEISVITGIPMVYESGNPNHDFIGRVRDRLEKWGYSCETPRGGAVIITHKPETAEDRLKEIMFRLFGLDIQTGTNGEMDNGATVFACFLHFMMTEQIAQTMPWGERYAWLEENYGVKVAYPCLNHWAKRLLENEIMDKSTGKSDAMWWMTYYIDGEKHREPVDENDPDLLAYKKRHDQIYSNKLRKTKDDWKSAYASTKKEMWQEYKCCYYQCKCLQVNGIISSEIETVLELVEEIVESHIDKLMAENPA